MNHELEQTNLFTQAIKVEGLQIKSIYAFSQRSIDWQIKPNTYFHGIRVIKATRLSNPKSQLKS